MLWNWEMKNYKSCWQKVSITENTLITIQVLAYDQYENDKTKSIIRIEASTCWYLDSKEQFQSGVQTEPEPVLNRI